MVSARSAVILALLQDGGVYAFDVTAGTKDQKQLTGKEKANTQTDKLDQNHKQIIRGKQINHVC